MPNTNCVRGLFVIFATLTACGTTTREAAEVRDVPASPERVEEDRDALKVFTTWQTTDGRNLKLRGRVENPHPDAVVGVRYRVCLMLHESKRELECFVEERDESELAARDSMALRLDIASMYASGRFWFSVEAYPMKLGDREVPEPAHWK